MQTPDFTKEHVDEILKHINTEAIRTRKFKVVVDMINASACAIDPYLFEKLGVELISLNDIPNGKFTHKPEPLKENLSGLSEKIKEVGADLGFAQDPDADRLVLADKNGEIISEECTLALTVENVLSKNLGGVVVINLSTSRMNKDIAEKYGGKTIFTKVGELNVVEGMLKHGAVIGGEGNGGVIFPEINLARDSFVGICLILEMLAERGKNLRECVDALPKYFMKKEKWQTGGENLKEIYEKLKVVFKDANINEIDGIRFDFEENHSWIHLRPSNTEPIIRLIGEAKEQKEIEALFERVKLTLAQK